MEMISEENYKTLKELKKWCAKHRLTIHSSASGEDVIISFGRNRQWFYLRTGNSNRSWTIRKSFTIKI